MERDTSTAGGLIVVAVAHALALVVAVAVTLNVSGGHVNPAVTLGAFFGGLISALQAIYYWISQILGAIVASLLLIATTAGLRPLGFTVGKGIGEWHAVLLEIILTFGLVYTVYATAIDPKRGSLGTIAPLAIGFIVGAVDGPSHTTYADHRGALLVAAFRALGLLLECCVGRWCSGEEVIVMLEERGMW